MLISNIENVKFNPNCQYISTVFIFRSFSIFFDLFLNFSIKSRAKKINFVVAIWIQTRNLDQKNSIKRQFESNSSQNLGLSLFNHLSLIH